MAEITAAIEVTGLSKQLAGRCVVRDVNLTVRAGEIVALTGANGAGKTTLLRCMSTAVRPTRGEIRWMGRPTPAHAASRRALIGYVAHESYLYPHLTVEENLLFAARMCRVTCAAERVREQLATAGLAHVGLQRVLQLSQGMRRRVSILRATVHRPLIVLLDEPFSGIDAEGRQWLIDRLEAMRRERHAICFVSHDPATVARLADRVFHMRSGMVSEAATPRPSPQVSTAPLPRAA